MEPWAVWRGPGTFAAFPAWITFHVDGVVTHMHHGRRVRRCDRHGIR